MTAIAQALSAALLAFIWQGLLVGFLLWTVLALLRNHPARSRYAVCCAALAAMALLPVVTACLLYRDPAAGAAPAVWAAARQTGTAAPGAAGSLAWGDRLSRWALPAWSLGVLLFSLRLVWASRQVSKLRRRATPAEATVLALVDAVRERMNVARPVRVLISTAADCPAVVGWLRPALLLPAATVMGLTAQQLEAILAHEFAHILRYDHLVNMLQTGVETLLFYHPAVWWASARIRQERELCCDDLAVASCGDALCLARALTRLERLRLTTPRLALSSNGSPLLYRIQRLAGVTGGRRGPSKLPGMLALSLGLVCLALNLQWARGQQIAPDLPGVHVDLHGASVIHRDDVKYPEAAIDKRVHGTVTVEATLDGDGEVNDARVISGPPELRKAALESVLQWHFTHDAAGSKRQVSIDFSLPPEGSESDAALRSALALRHASSDRELQEVLGARVLDDARVKDKMAKDLAEAMALQARPRAAQSPEDAEREARELTEQRMKIELDVDSAQLKGLLDSARRDQRRKAQEEKAEAEALLGKIQQDSVLAGDAHFQLDHLKELLQGPVLAGHILKAIDVEGLSAAVRDELLAQLQVRAGDTLSEESVAKLFAAVKRFDEHLSVSIATEYDGQVRIHIAAPGSSDLN